MLHVCIGDPEVKLGKTFIATELCFTKASHPASLLRLSHASLA